MRVEITEKAMTAIAPKLQAPLDGVASMLVELRKLACMSQKQVSEVIGLTRSSVANIETGRQPMAVESLEMLASHLGLEVVVTVSERRSNSGVEPARQD